MEYMNVFSKEFEVLIAENIQRVLLEAEKQESIRTTNDNRNTMESKTACSYCQVNFPDLQSQRDHYKLDWHRYNLKQSLLDKSSITEDEFNEKSSKDDLSSISGSDSDEREETVDTYANALGKIFLQNNKKQVISVYKCLLFDRKEHISEDVLESRLNECCVNNKQWTILMLGGGHFAGAVFKGEEPVLHKTFHSYTVRSGQGSGQSSRDNKSGGSQPKSAGASLRRYNEQALVQHIKSITEGWKSEINKSSLIMYRASGPFNRSVLFGGSTPLLDRTDTKLRTIPFSTRRATLKEVKRVQSLLSTAEIYDNLEKAAEKYTFKMFPQREFKRNKIRVSSINRAKSREIVERPLPTTIKSSDNSESELNNLDECSLDCNDLVISFQELEEFGDSLTPEQRKKLQKKNKPKKSKNKKLKEREEARKLELVNTIAKGDINKLEELLENHLFSQTNNSKDANVKHFVNQIIDDNSNSLLHCAALNEQSDLVKFLLDKGSDPCLKNKNQYTAYTCTHSTEIRNILKLFAKENPDLYNYNKAQIPINTLTNEELTEKRKFQRKIKKEKEKEKKKDMAIQKKENEEKERFLKLSDREKRALAAEKRILNQSGTVIKRCFFCAKDITGKVPFEYMTNLFCTIDCLKAHRIRNPVPLS